MTAGRREHARNDANKEKYFTEEVQKQTPAK